MNMFVTTGIRNSVASNCPGLGAEHVDEHKIRYFSCCAAAAAAKGPPLIDFGGPPNTQ